VQALGGLRGAQPIHQGGQRREQDPVPPLALGITQRPGQMRFPQPAPAHEERPDALGNQIGGEQVQVPAPEFPGGGVVLEVERVHGLDPEELRRLDAGRHRIGIGARLEPQRSRRRARVARVAHEHVPRHHDRSTGAFVVAP